MKKHIGSTIALVCGWLSIISVLGNYANPGASVNGTSVVTGIVILLGASAYRSAKRRSLGERSQSITRKSLEIFSIIVCCLLVVMRNDYLFYAENDPFPHVFIPLWVLIAYMTAILRRPRETGKDST